MAAKKNKSETKGQDQQANDTNLTDEVTSAASEATSTVTDTVQDVAGGFTQQIRQQVDDQLSTYQDRAAGILDTVALLLQQAGEHAGDADKETITTYAGQAAEKVEHWSNTIREQNVDKLLNDAKQFAQSNPGFVVGGALAAGYLGARLLGGSPKTLQSGGESEQTSGDTGYQTPAGYERAFQEDVPAGDVGSTEPVVPFAGTVVHETSLGTGTATGVTDTAGLEGTIFEEDAAILEELQNDELNRQEEEALGESAETDPLDDLLDPETR